MVRLGAVVLFLIPAGCEFDPGGFISADSGLAADDGAASMLASRGLVVRYFADDSDEGTAAGLVTDAAEPPLDLAIDAAQGVVSFAERDGNRGIEWQQNQSDDTVRALIADTKIADQIGGAQAVTIEAVVDVDELNTLGTRFLTIANADDVSGCLTLRTNGGINELDPANDDVMITTNKDDRHLWDVALEGMGRTTLHVVYDSAQQMSADRARLFINGEEQLTTQIEQNIAQNDALVVSNCSHLGIGNRTDGGRGARQTIYYAALYAVALTPGEVAANAERLEPSDDQ